MGYPIEGATARWEVDQHDRQRHQNNSHHPLMAYEYAPSIGWGHQQKEEVANIERGGEAEKMEKKKSGVGDLDEEGMVSDFLLEDTKGSGATNSTTKK